MRWCSPWDRGRINPYPCLVEGWLKYIHVHVRARFVACPPKLDPPVGARDLEVPVAAMAQAYAHIRWKQGWRTIASSAGGRHGAMGAVTFSRRGPLAWLGLAVGEHPMRPGLVAQYHPAATMTALPRRRPLLWKPKTAGRIGRAFPWARRMGRSIAPRPAPGAELIIGTSQPVGA